MTDNKSKTVTHLDGRILYYELNQFISDIVQGNRCFICGANPSKRIFNDEHVIPNWILKKFKLNNKRIILPNKTRIKYSNYKVPCCEKCNSELGRHFEVPISQLLSKPYDKIANELNESFEKRNLLFRWLCLIYFKTHLKDKKLRASRDFRDDDVKIGDRFNWVDFHHIHCIIRAHHTGAKIDNGVFGSVYLNKIVNIGDIRKFDYMDNTYTKGVLLQLGDFCVASILDDSCASISMYNEQISKVERGISIFQFYEIFSHLNYVRLHLAKRPVFKSIITSSNDYKIIAERPEHNKLVNKSKRIGTHGDFLKICLQKTVSETPETRDFLNNVKEGKLSFLWDENGNFKSVDE